NDEASSPACAGWLGSRPFLLCEGGHRLDMDIFVDIFVAPRSVCPGRPASICRAQLLPHAGGARDGPAVEAEPAADLCDHAVAVTDAAQSHFAQERLPVG
ncbi:MAG: hypothetical protein ABI068_06130, partial [Ktedonobacterales bacterium]